MAKGGDMGVGEKLCLLCSNSVCVYVCVSLCVCLHWIRQFCGTISRVTFFWETKVTQHWEKQLLIHYVQQKKICFCQITATTAHIRKHMKEE